MSTKAIHESEISKTAVTKGQVLIVATSCGKFADGTPTGLWLAELAEPYYVFKSQGYDVTLSSPIGGEVPVDPASLADGALTDEARRFQNDDEASLQLGQTVPLAVIQDPAFYDIIFMPGGHGPVFDLSQDARLGEILSKAFAAGKCVAAVCHGPAGLMMAKDESTGKPLVAGRTITAFTTEEEKSVKKDHLVPWLLDAKLAEMGAKLTKGPGPWQPHVEVDGKLVTGQNPASSTGVAEAAIKVASG